MPQGRAELSHVHAGEAAQSSPEDVVHVLRHVIHAAQLLARADGAAILLYDHDAEKFMPTVPSGAVGLDEQWLQRRGLSAVQSLALQAVAQHDVVDVPDTATTPDLDFPLLSHGRRPGAVGVVPMYIEDTVVGALSFYDAAPRPTPLDREALLSFATVAVHAVSLAHLRDREQASLIRLQALDEASNVLAAELSRDQLLQRIVEIAARLANARYGALGVVGKDGYLDDFITTGISAEERSHMGNLPRGYGLLGVLIHEGKPLRVPNIAGDHRRVGFPPHHPPMTSLLGVPIRVHGAVVGDLYLADKIGAPAFSDEDQHLIELLSTHAGIAIENARLYAEVQEVALLRERERISRDLHDGIIQDIYGAMLQIENIVDTTQDAQSQRQLQGVNDQLSAVIADVRTYIQGLRARELEGRLLPDGIGTLVQEFNAHAGVAVTWAVDGTIFRLSDEVANTLLQITREGLANIVKHAEATQVNVQVRYTAFHVTLTLGDNGQGFDVQAPRGTRHQGLRNLASRVREVGGTLTVQSAPGAGTTITVSVPAPQH